MGIWKSVIGNPAKVLALRRYMESLAGQNAPAPLLEEGGKTAIEDGFPFEAISDVAEVESWRKEVYRPVYHLHKWWAQRLGSIFRAAILGAFTAKGSSVMDLFYQPISFDGKVVFDPFMGSGTTVGEAHKLGCTAVGRDINPVAYRSVRTALSRMDRDILLSLFDRLQEEVGDEILSLYKTVDSQGEQADVLYFFWVKFVSCPECEHPVDLFPRFVFARHAYPKKYPTVHVVCPGCGEVFAGLHGEKSCSCPTCSRKFDPQIGPAQCMTASCPSCSNSFPIAKTVRKRGKPPEHRLYAKLVLRRDGKKEYLRATQADFDAYKTASRRLATADVPLPKTPISDGFNTKQVLNYGYACWADMFNDRQKLALSILATGIRKLEQCPERDALVLLFSGALEFNNMFASYKGEGTGAVRHMFSHHILKPERMPIEANLWGTRKSSGSFSTLFRSRILRAIDYKEGPFEVAVKRSGKRKTGEKICGISPPMGGDIVDAFPEGGLPRGGIYVSCGDSAKTDLPSGSVDLVLTDPPFFDNVHYSELADFFYVWQQRYFTVGADGVDTTRNAHEVQDTDASSFSRKLADVFRECCRVLKDGGLLVFSYHHSRDDGWESVANAVLRAGLTFVRSQPVKAEMSVATPKMQAKEPIDLDVLLVCRKRAFDTRPRREIRGFLTSAMKSAEMQVHRLNRVGRRLSKNDVKIIVFSNALVDLSAGRNAEEVRGELEDVFAQCQEGIERLASGQVIEQADEKPNGRNHHHIFQGDLPRFTLRMAKILRAFYTGQHHYKDGYVIPRTVATETRFTVELLARTIKARRTKVDEDLALLHAMGLVARVTPVVTQPGLYYGYWRLTTNGVRILNILLTGK